MIARLPPGATITIGVRAMGCPARQRQLREGTAIDEQSAGTLEMGAPAGLTLRHIERAGAVVNAAGPGAAVRRSHDVPS